MASAAYAAGVKKKMKENKSSSEAKAASYQTAWRNSVSAAIIVKAAWHRQQHRGIESSIKHHQRRGGGIENISSAALSISNIIVCMASPSFLAAKTAARNKRWQPASIGVIASYGGSAASSVGDGAKHQQASGNIKRRKISAAMKNSGAKT